MLVGALAQVERGEVKAEHLHGADQRLQARRDQRSGMVAAQRNLNRPQIHQQIFWRGIRVLRCDSVAQCLGAGQLVQRGSQTRVDAGQRTAIGLVHAVRVLIRAALGQQLHRRRDVCEAGRDRELGTELMHFSQIVAQGHFALALERVA